MVWAVLWAAFILVTGVAVSIVGFEAIPSYFGYNPYKGALLGIAWTAIMVGPLLVVVANGGK